MIVVVRLIGLEPTRLTTPDPKSGAAANYATGAKTLFRNALQRYMIYPGKANIECFFFIVLDI